MKNKKIIIGIVLFLTIIFVTYYIYKDNNISVSILKENNNVSNTIAVYIKDENGNYQESEQIPQEGYQLNNEKSTCSNGVIPEWDTKNHRFYTDNLTKSGTSCYLYFDKRVPTGSETILANVTVNENTPDFSQVATTDEGVFITDDPMYGANAKTYYWRGAATTNYLKFAGFCWRIVRINGDGTLRLIYDGTTCHQNGESTTDSIAVSNAPYNLNSNQSNYVGWTYEGQLQRPTSETSGMASNAKTELESWYNTNIAGANDSKVAQGKYCNDRNAGSGYAWAIRPNSTFYYAAITRRDNNSPTLSCPSEDIYRLKIGLITMDEAMYAGGRGEDNTSYYLCNVQNYWTMSPRYWDGTDNWAGMVLVQANGYLSALYANYDVDTKLGLRPVINLKSDITFSSGNGTLDNPYIVAD